MFDSLVLDDPVFDALILDALVLDDPMKEKL